MVKKKKHEEHENLERWLVSYADFITLLFATFVILYALSIIDLEKFKHLKISLQQAFSPPNLIQGATSLMDKSGKSILDSNSMSEKSTIVSQILDNAELKFESEYEKNAFKSAKKEIDNLENVKNIEGVQSTITDRGLEVILIDSVFFNSGSAEIKKSAYPILKKIATLLKQKFPAHLIRVEGHTDNTNIKSALYPSNWELSSARASSVVRFLITNLFFKKDRLAAVGYGDSKPIASNATEEGKKKNRRVEIIVLRNKLISAEPYTQGLDKERLEYIKKLQKPVPKKSKSPNTISDAARALLKETGMSKKNVLLYNDSYDMQAQQISEEIKAKEAAIKGGQHIEQPVSNNKKPPKK